MTGVQTCALPIYMTAFAYVIALIVYQLGGLLLGIVHFNVFTIVALVLLGALIYLLCRKGYEPDREAIIGVELNGAK